jgi:hypothetical protein
LNFVELAGKLCALYWTVVEPMYCPICKAEYRDNFARCSTCDVGLIPELRQDDETRQDECAELLWAGHDPRTFEDLKKILDNAEIPFTTDYPTAYLLFPAMRSPLQIRVLSSDIEKANKLRREYFGDHEQETEDSSYDQGRATNMLRTTGGTDVPVFSSDCWDPEAATYEIWTGSDIQMLQIIGDCLRENGIGSFASSDANRRRLMIHPDDEFRARQIIQEIEFGAESE